MYHIVRTKSKTKPTGIIQTSVSGEVLSSHSVKTLQSAFKNIIASLKNVKGGDGNIYFLVQDDRKKIPLLYNVYVNGADGNVELTGDSPFPKYIPGKNPKRKK